MENSVGRFIFGKGVCVCVRAPAHMFTVICICTSLLITVSSHHDSGAGVHGALSATL